MDGGVLYPKFFGNMSIAKPVKTFVLQKGFSKIQYCPFGVVNSSHRSDFTY
jgi:hypothetical protein